MRVLVVTNDLPPRIGGIQYYVDQLSRGLSEAGDDVTLYGSSYEGHSAWDRAAPFRVVRERTSTLLPTPLVLRHTLRLIERYEPEVVVFGAAFPLALMGTAIVKRTGVPYAAFTHGLEVSAARVPGGSKLLRRIGDDASLITFVSGWCDRMLRPSFGPAPRYEMLPPAVDDSLYNPGVDALTIRDRHGLGDDPVVVCVSRVVERKGQDTLVRILPELRRRVPNARLLIVGGGPYLNEIRSQARASGVADHITVTGQVPEHELPAHFAAGDVFAMPCRERRGGLEVEAFGIVFIQAEGIGRPVVAGNIGGVPDALVDGETGLLVDSESDPAVVDAVAALLGDPERATVMGEAGSRFVHDRFTWAHRTAELRQLLSEVVEGR